MTLYDTTKMHPLDAMRDKMRVLEATNSANMATCKGIIQGLQAERDALQAQLAAAQGKEDSAYLERNRLVALLSKVFPSGKKKTAIEGWSEDWHGCVYIDLPTGQASWHYHDSQAWLFEHLPEYQGAWDGHLWHVNNGPMAPIPLRSSETAAYEARKQLRDLLTHEERGLAINQVHALLAAAPQPKDMK